MIHDISGGGPYVCAMAEFLKSTKSNKPPARRKPGRPTAGQVLDIDEKILIAALALFLKNGYMATSMEAVGIASGVAKRTLYARYPEKPQLFRAIVQERLAKWSKVAPFDPITGSKPVPELLIEYGTNFLAGLRIDEVNLFYKLMFTEGSRFPELSRELYVSGHDLAVQHLARGLERSLALTGGRIKDSDAVARAFTSALLGWFQGESMAKAVNSEECDVFVRHLTRIFLAGQAGW
ncbi:MAG TPA: TetR/AcrR family transcriptional regulator [Sphingobium sp.]|uniref:TetR/AcrR family transcriptional regulator n=1 Tax=Sphingobium sp. TaxID=1912891 RepID=UPI002ED1B327